MIVAALALMASTQVLPIRCDDRNSGDVEFGTAFRVENGYATDEHVWEFGRCNIHDVRVKSNRMAPDVDFAMLRSDSEAPALQVLCKPLDPGQTYTAIGYHEGSVVTISITPTGQVVRSNPSFSKGELNSWVVTGSAQFQEGMSGGPVLDSEGRVVGLILGYNPRGNESYVRSVVDTPLCRDN
jgi:hypothetical protein